MNGIGEVATSVQLQRGMYAPDDRSTATVPYAFYIRDLKVAGAPQRQLALSATAYPAEGMVVTGVGKFYGAHYAHYEPFDRTDPAETTTPTTPRCSSAIRVTSTWASRSPSEPPRRSLRPVRDTCLVLAGLPGDLG